MEIHPFEGVGELRFGQSRHSVREALGSGYESFRKGGSTSATDAYNQLSIHLYYDDNDCLEFVEAFGQALVSVQGILFLGRDLNDVENDLNAIGYMSERRDGGLQSDSAGISLYAPSGTVEAVSVFRQGYYDS